MRRLIGSTPSKRNRVTRAAWAGDSGMSVVVDRLRRATRPPVSVIHTSPRVARRNRRVRLVRKRLAST